MLQDNFDEATVSGLKNNISNSSQWTWAFGGPLEIGKQIREEDLVDKDEIKDQLEEEYVNRKHDGLPEMWPFGKKAEIGEKIEGDVIEGEDDDDDDRGYDDNDDD